MMVFNLCCDTVLIATLREIHLVHSRALNILNFNKCSTTRSILGHYVVSIDIGLQFCQRGYTLRGDSKDPKTVFFKLDSRTLEPIFEIYVKFHDSLMVFNLF